MPGIQPKRVTPRLLGFVAVPRKLTRGIKLNICNALVISVPSSDPQNFGITQRSVRTRECTALVQ